MAVSCDYFYLRLIPGAASVNREKLNKSLKPLKEPAHFTQNI